MNLTAIILLALAMSTDAFAAAIVKGATMQKPHLLQAIRIGIVFGVIEGITPLIGWSIGSVASKFVSEWDHWIAFVLLVGLGGRMIWVGLHEQQTEDKPQQQSFMMLALTALATSIDALAVGVGLAFVDVSILKASIAIGLATTLMVTIGVMVGHVLSGVIGRRAEMLGGFVLIGVGATILYEHLSGAA
jgi:putative Mn2+ efflux pump MntP